ncbi:hypothetical protein Dvina_20845 [Dactylosporangium vinaceum]|uniref:CBM6 domain-containing protein n=1 Tax=Dactylosporangium vinaceum TaxID=53362 RepID=A0ABV5MS46_9ACTN|nr:hypothetical protein [Dactylosporangium vinaceum]UAC00293.1 hypothetical protein Dvina_20845 [Dactylosporangium vinaceum]
MRQWIGVTAVAAGIAAAAIVVPPLLLPDRDESDDSPASVTGKSARPDQPPGSALQPGAGSGAPGSGGASPGPASTAPASPSAPGAFTPIAVQAEDPANRITGGASAVACASCRGGRRVRYMCADCTLTVKVTLPSAGTRTVTVYYEADGNRSIKVRIGGGTARTFPVTGPDWTVPQSLRFTADLPAGEVQLTLFNDDAPAPDLDEIVIA